MKKIFALCFGAVLLVGAALALHAQGPGSLHRMGGHGGHMGAMDADHMKGMEEFLAKALDLTDAQKAAARKIHEEIAAKAMPLMEQHRQQMEEVHALLDGANPDATEIGQKVIAAHATGEQLKALHEEAMAKFTPLLNADQLEKLKKLHEMHGGHEGFGGPESGL
jgi:Spy/CpxP family protein refolding chaperone